MNESLRASGAESSHRLQKVIVPPHLPTWAVLLIVTIAVLAGAMGAWIAARVAGIEGLVFAAGLGAIGAIVAAVVGAIAIGFSTHTASGRDDMLIRAASPTHPLLRRLMTEAPGTYVHSVAAANLSEAAAEAVGADALVARVGAYYHDIGKLAQPGYFFENQEDDCNPHEGTRPADSAGIIMSHVTDGYALGREYRLPEPVLAIIRQHHGTSVVRYFFHRAAEADASAFEADFRYPGEPPKSREAAIVMLADSSEASIRAMSKPDPEEISESVSAVIAERTRDGQLALSGLSDEDLRRIQTVFVKQLVSFRHVRCPYPSQSQPTKGVTDADQRPQPSGA
ncbi:MAG TPA: HDIG domain-containing protein [Coriobacteriia bacterium]|nr:HDIG domain-containing protein [Coriobacteriia bacterium]